jgi:uncharacterized membrane protein YhaH (DUF805 family)
MDHAWSLFSFRGRIGRGRFLAVQLALTALWLASWLEVSLLSSSLWEALRGAITVAMIWINLATTARRLHDLNMNGWWAIAVFAVSRLSYLYYGLLLGLSFGVNISIAEELLLALLAAALSLLQTGIVIALVFVSGTDGPNRFGLDPTRDAPQSPSGLRAEPVGVPDFLVRHAEPLPRT